MKLHNLWSADDEAYLKQHYVKGNSAACAAALGRSAASVKCKLRRLKVPTGRVAGVYRHKYWTVQDDDLLRCLYPHSFSDALAVFFKATPAAINVRASFLKIKKSKAYWQYLHYKIHPDLHLQDSVIVKKHFKIKDRDAVQEFIALYPELIELKRNEIKLNGKLREFKRKAAGTAG